VGNPLGLTGSISAGVISGFDRRYRLANQDAYLERLIQFDAAVNIGSSGGPLLNRNGEVVGIVVGLVNPTAQEAFSGIGFAVRIDQAAAAAGAPEL
ncbi:MAG: trypsin-like peptidase domain-containing protein, partial [Caldilineaceae bacterium]|nr:trypsin-like peptidase domain-containing protein [Caldilineaceae bacterium]